MANVGLDDEFTDDRPIFVAIGVFQPVEDAREEVDGKDDANDLRNYQSDF